MMGCQRWDNNNRDKGGRGTMMMMATTTTTTQQHSTPNCHCEQLLTGWKGGATGGDEEGDGMTTRGEDNNERT